MKPPYESQRFVERPRNEILIFLVDLPTNTHKEQHDNLVANPQTLGSKSDYMRPWWNPLTLSRFSIWCSKLRLFEKRWKTDNHDQFSILFCCSVDFWYMFFLCANLLWFNGCPYIFNWRIPHNMCQNIWRNFHMFKICTHVIHIPHNCPSYFSLTCNLHVVNSIYI